MKEESKEQLKFIDGQLASIIASYQFKGYMDLGEAKNYNQLIQAKAMLEVFST